jgi:hypothetical protein
MNHFNDSKSFMVRPDGRIGYNTKRDTWAAVLLHGLALDDVFFRQDYRPPLPFNIQKTQRRDQKVKEKLNDDDLCDICKHQLDTIVFRTNKNGIKSAICLDCSEDLNMSENIQFFNEYYDMM